MCACYRRSWGGEHTRRRGPVAAATRQHSPPPQNLLPRAHTRLPTHPLPPHPLQVRVHSEDAGGKRQAVRLMATSMGGQWLKTDGYVEYLDPVTGVTVAYCALEDGEEGMCYIEPYPVASELSAKRAVARRIGTTYAYDFLGLFEKGVVSEWQAAIAAGTADAMPPNLLEAEELLLDAQGSLYKGSRTVGENKVGLGWPGPASFDPVAPPSPWAPRPPRPNAPTQILKPQPVTPTPYA